MKLVKFEGYYINPKHIVNISTYDNENLTHYYGFKVQFITSEILYFSYSTKPERNDTLLEFIEKTGAKVV